ncbi:ABC transporter ATP-binding protein [Sciscionella sediminilitoris]|uniref:ABC transporter ATP-binding protein n=1 Tax=Sciscionella sediminilitoris TaxID=1445613 RepID=UPI0004DFC121|nr:ABC transporter ATP-binding protein [Sciscionella sp. SE31]
MTSMLSIRELTVDYGHRSLFTRRTPALALDRVSIEVVHGESLGIVGESGCGKSTLAKCLVGLVQPASGEIRLEDRLLTTRRDREHRRRVQMVFQDPSASLNPSMTVGKTLAELLRVHRLVPTERITARVHELLDMVELPAELAKAAPASLSGGQKQRVGIARALALEPDVLIADEAVAALDVSVQAAILNLLRRLRHELGLTLLFITHDLAVVRQISDRVTVMYLGRVVETQPTERFFANAHHPYSRALLATAPRIGEPAPPVPLRGEPASLHSRPPGCAFHPRCPSAGAECGSRDPELLPITEDTFVACHYAVPGSAR